MSLNSFADLAELPGFEHIESQPMLALIERFAVARPDIGADTLKRGAAALFQVPPHAQVSAMTKVLRSMAVGHLCRLWRHRPPRLSTQLDEALRGVLGPFATFLGEVVGEHKPQALALPEHFAAMKVGVFRRRLARYLPEFYRELGIELSYASDTIDLATWSTLPPPRGLSDSGRASLGRLGRRIEERAANAAYDDHMSTVHSLTTHRERPLADLLGDQLDAPPPPASLRGAGGWRVDEAQRRVQLQMNVFDACMVDVCDEVIAWFENPTQPKISCAYSRNIPCTLKRHCLETMLEAAVGFDAGLPPNLRDQLRSIVHADAGDLLIARLNRVNDRSDSDKPEGATLGWLFVPYEKLDLVWLTKKKKGGLKSKRISKQSASQHIERPSHHIALTLLESKQTYAMRRHASVPMQFVAPALAQLTNDPSVFIAVPGEEIVPLKVEVHTPRLAPVQTESGMTFKVALGPVRLHDNGLEPGEWITHYDGHGKVFVGVVNEALIDALRAVRGLGTVELKAEHREKVAESLLLLDRRVPLAPDSSWLGKRHAIDHRWVLKLEYGGFRGHRFVFAELGLRIVPELGVLTPCEGTETLPLKRPGDNGVEIGHVQRDFEREGNEAQDLIERLGMSPDDGFWSERIDILEEALALLSRAQDLSNAGQLEVAWAGSPVAVQRAKKPDKLSIRLGMKKDWFDLQGGFQLDGSELPLKELLEALRQNKRFVEVDDTTIVELDEELRKSLAPLTSLAREQSGKVIASPLSAPLVEELERSGVNIEAPTEWLELTDRLDEARTLMPVLPPLNAELRPYQVDGFTWVMRLAHWARGACLADDMGLGKTLQGLAVISARAKLGPTLVIAPTSVVPNWVREAAKFAPNLEVRRVLQGSALESALAMIGPNVVLVTSWDLLVRNDTRLQNVALSDGTFAPWTTVVLDEAHAMKNATTRRAQAARGLDRDFVLALTGTPVENRPMELWSLFSVVAPGLLGSAESFRDRFAKPIEEKNADAARFLARLVRPFLLRRTKGEVATDLPRKSEIRVDVILTAEERERYQKVRMAAVNELDKLGSDGTQGAKGMIRVLAVLTRMRQLASHPRLVDPKAPATSSKLERLIELADELRGEGRKMLVFSQFVELLHLVRDAFDKAELTYAYLDGSTPGTEREKLVNRFQSGEVDAFLLSLKAGGVGLNLTMATEVIHLDPWWNPAVEDQASDRAHRIGQDKPVTVYRLVANGTIEEQILGLHNDKRLMVSSLLEGTASAAALSSEDMLALLMGSPDDVRDDGTDEPGNVTTVDATTPGNTSQSTVRRLRTSLLDDPDELDAEDDYGRLVTPDSVADAAPAAKVSITPSGKPIPQSPEQLMARVMDALTRSPMGLGKAEILAETAVPDGLWSDFRSVLASHPAIEVVGTKRATRYRLKATPTPDKPVH